MKNSRYEQFSEDEENSIRQEKSKSYMKIHRKSKQLSSMPL